MEEAEGWRERLRDEMRRVSAEGASSSSLMKLWISDRIRGMIRKWWQNDRRPKAFLHPILPQLKIIVLRAGSRLAGPRAKTVRGQKKKKTKLTYHSTLTQSSSQLLLSTTSHRDVLSYAWAYRGCPWKGRWPWLKLANSISTPGQR
jgi:hypothetical protein